MIKDLPPPAEAEEYRNTAEIIRDLAAQVRFGTTRSELFNCSISWPTSPSPKLKLWFRRFPRPLTTACLELVPTSVRPPPYFDRAGHDVDTDQAAQAMRDDEMLQEIEDFLEGFNQPTYRGMRIDGVRVHHLVEPARLQRGSRPDAEWLH
jgi:hypothetical protein